MDDEGRWIKPRDKVSPESPSDDLSPSEKFPLPMLIPLIKSLSEHQVTIKQKK